MKLARSWLYKSEWKRGSMKNYISMIFYSLFTIGLIGTIVIIKKDIDSDFALYFMIGFVVLILLRALYDLGRIIWDIARMNGSQFKKGLLQFCVLALSLSAINLVVNWFRQSHTLSFHHWGTPLMFAFILSFYDVKTKMKNY